MGDRPSGSLYATHVMLVLVFALLPGRLRTFAVLIPVSVGIGAAAPFVLHADNKLSPGGAATHAVGVATAVLLVAAPLVGAAVAVGGAIVAALDLALQQIPAEYIEKLQILVRADSAGATHELADYCHDRRMRFSVGYELTEQVRAAILKIPEKDGSARDNGQVAEITDRLELSSWPEGSRLIVRRERPHPGAQLSFTDHNGYRFQAILTDQPDEHIALLECRHRQHARVEDRVRDDKDPGLAKFPFKEFQLKKVWLEIVMLAHGLIVWTQTLLLSGKVAKAEPKRLRYRLLHVAGRLAFSGRKAKLRLQHTWPWAQELIAAFQKLEALPATAG